jgi:hypothetical protein
MAAMLLPAQPLELAATAAEASAPPVRGLVSSAAAD